MIDAAASPRISFVVPLFNTGGGLPALLDAFEGLQLDETWELILVDDGSTDGTPLRAKEQLQQFPGMVTLVELARNFGEHAAVLEGYRAARGEFVVNLDDDLQTPVSEAVRLLENLQSSDAEVIYSFYERKQHHWLRNVGSRVINAMATFLLGKPQSLYLSSCRAVRRSLLERVIKYHGPYPYIDGLILSATNRIGRLTVKHVERANGRSGYTWRKLLRLTATVLFNFSIMPLRLASVLGLLLCLTGAAMLVMVVAEAWRVGRVQPGWSSLMTMLTVFSGAQLLMLGVIGEYVGRGFMTVSCRPQALVRSVTLRSQVP